MTLKRSFTIRQDTFHELFISIVKSRLTSAKQIFTNGRSVKTILKSNDLIGLRSNHRLKKLPIQMPRTQLNENILNLQF